MAFGARKNQFVSGGGNGSDSKAVSPFLSLRAKSATEPGDFYVRVLEDSYPYRSYFLRGIGFNGNKTSRSVIVGDYNNPIRNYMESLDENDPSYARLRLRHMVNAIEFKLKEDGSGFDHRLVIIDISNTLNDQLIDLDSMGVIDNSTLEKMSLFEYNIRIRVRGVGRDTVYSVNPANDPRLPSDRILPADVMPTKVYDLAEMTKPLPDEVLKMIVEGVDWSEIMDKMDRKLGDYPMIEYQNPLTPF